jgi:hypothetical protein
MGSTPVVRTTPKVGVPSINIEWNQRICNKPRFQSAWPGSSKNGSNHRRTRTGTRTTEPGLNGNGFWPSGVAIKVFGGGRHGFMEKMRP